jgi:hypothetical protein
MVSTTTASGIDQAVSRIAKNSFSSSGSQVFDCESAEITHGAEFSHDLRDGRLYCLTRQPTGCVSDISPSFAQILSASIASMHAVSSASQPVRSPPARSEDLLATLGSLAESGLVQHCNQVGRRR